MASAITTAPDAAAAAASSASSSSPSAPASFALPLPPPQPREQYLWRYFTSLATSLPEYFSHLAVQRSERKGRYLVTDRCYNVGDIIFTEHPILTVSDDPSVCLACGVRHAKGNCQAYNNVFLPMKLTLSNADSIAEQTGYDPSRIRGIMKWLGLAYSSIFAPVRGANRNLTEEMRREKCPEWVLLGLDDGSVSTENQDSNPITYSSTPRPSDPDRTLVSTLIHNALPLTWKKLFSKEIIEQVVNVLELNAHETSEIVVPSETNPSPSILPPIDGTPGDAVFPFFAMIEHSCWENCAWSITGGQMRISALREITPSRESMDFSFTHAIVRDMSSAFEKSLQQHPPPTPIDVGKAEEQHRVYMGVLKSILGEQNVTEIASSHELPDCNFIEDTALILNDILLLTNPGAESRKGEVVEVGRSLNSFPFARTYTLSAPATMDGGDVLFTGKHLFVGLSSRTNSEAVEQCRKWFQGPLGEEGHRTPFTVHPIHVRAGLHLKSVLSILDSEVLVIDQSQAAKAMKEEILKVDPAYQFITVPEGPPSNVLRVRSTLLIQRGFPESEKILRTAAEQRGLDVVTLDMSELIKADGALTCGSLLSKVGPKNAMPPLTPPHVKPLSPLSINYAPPYQSTGRRRKYLQEKYGFHCICPLCSGELPDRTRSFHCLRTPKCSGTVSPYGEGTEGRWSVCKVCNLPPSKEGIEKYTQAEQALLAHLCKRAVASSYTPETIFDALMDDPDLVKGVRYEIEQVAEAVLAGAGATASGTTASSISSAAPSPSSAPTSSFSSSSAASVLITPNRSKTQRKLAAQQRKKGGKSLGTGSVKNDSSASSSVSSTVVPLSSDLRTLVQILTPQHSLVHQLLEMVLALAIHAGQHSGSSSEAAPHWTRAQHFARLRLENIQQISGKHHWSLAREEERLASVQVMAGLPSQAVSHWKAAYEVHRTLFGAEADSTRRAKARVDNPPQNEEQL